MCYCVYIVYNILCLNISSIYITVHLHFDSLIREYIYSLGLKLGSTLPPHTFRRAYIYSLEKK